MSFKTKTLLLLIALSLLPYIVTMVILGNAYRNEFDERVRNNMEQQLHITVERLNQTLATLKRDLTFVTSLDLMNDVVTGDYDRRITNLLADKKRDLQLLGDVDIVDDSGVVIASSDALRIGSKVVANAFLAIPVFSSFAPEEPVGELRVFYEKGNLTRLFSDDKNQHYFLSEGDADTLDDSSDSLQVSQTLHEYPGWSVVLKQDKQFAFSLLQRLESTFLLALSIGAIVIGGIAIFVARLLVKPILQLSDVANRVTASQDYSLRVNLPRRDEIGELATALNSMISGTDKMITQLQEEAETKLRLSEETNRAEMLQKLSTKLSRYLSPQIYESIFAGERDVEIGSSRKKLTIFFSDIVDFTGTTDQMESEDLTQLLNSYLSEMTDIALHYGATIDKYIGDAIMIFFGDPSSQGLKKDAELCVEMAVAMQQRVRELHQLWREQGFTSGLNIRIGIHTGYCTVGNFGTNNRMDYTIVGSAVNLASRIEGEAGPGNIMLSEDTWLLVKDRFPCCPARSVTLKGFSQPVHLYQVTMADAAGNGRIEINEEGFYLHYQPGELSDEQREVLRNTLLNITDNMLKGGQS